MHTNCEENFSSEAKKEKTPYRRIKREEFRWYKNERNGKKDPCTGIDIEQQPRS